MRIRLISVTLEYTDKNGLIRISSSADLVKISVRLSMLSSLELFNISDFDQSSF